MSEQAKSSKSRREWPRVPVPPALFDLLIMVATAHGRNERTLYVVLYQALKNGFPEDFEKLGSYFDLEEIEKMLD